VLIDVAVGMAVDDLGEDVGQIGERIDIVQLILHRLIVNPDHAPGS
jgi:hypothetical protein